MDNILFKFQARYYVTKKQLIILVYKITECSYFISILDTLQKYATKEQLIILLYKGIDCSYFISILDTLQNYFKQIDYNRASLLSEKVPYMETHFRIKITETDGRNCPPHWLRKNTARYNVQRI